MSLIPLCLRAKTDYAEESYIEQRNHARDLF